jgi:hypothetical protein
MYAAYSVLTLFVFILVSPYFLYQAIRYKKYIGSLRQRLGYLPLSFNVDGDEIDVLVAERRPHDIPADAADSVDTNLHRHR